MSEIRFFRHIFCIVICALFGLLYVHQQVELLRINYSLNHNRDNLSLLLDQKSTLMYNVVRLQSPFYLEQGLSAKNVNVEIPSRWHTIALAVAEVVK